MTDLREECLLNVAEKCRFIMTYSDKKLDAFDVSFCASVFYDDFSKEEILDKILHL